jgi:hypothetical protein
MAAFKIAIFPLNRPFRHRAKHICQKVVLKPKAIADTADPMQPYTLVKSCVSLKKAHDD